MFGFRRWRAAASGGLGVLAIVPVLAVVLAALSDRGPAGEVRVSLFPAVLLALDPFAWTCARNSVIFAVVVTAASLFVGVGLGWAVGRRPFWGRSVLRAAVAASLAAPPVSLALGLLGLWGVPRPWPWPLAAGDAGIGGLSLESWRAVPLWVLWIWSTLPGSVAVVMLATASAVERLDPAWEEAARLAGAGRWRIWFGLIGPLVRPAAARASSLIFPMALVEPGAPLILGLRRTLAFQVVEAAARPEPFPRVAAWSLMAGLLALGGRLLLRRWGGPALLAQPRDATAGRERAPRPRRATVLQAMIWTPALAGWAMLGWLPLLGLLRLLWGVGSEPGAPPSPGAVARSLPELSWLVLDPPIPQLATNSLVLGLEAAAAILIGAWLVRPALGSGGTRPIGSHLSRSIALLPPLLQGVGILALPRLAGLAADWLRGLPGCRGWASSLGHLAVELSRDRDPWLLLVCAVGLTVGLRLVWAWDGSDSSDPGATRSRFEAALLAGASRVRARGVGASWLTARGFGRFLLAASLAATGLTPALLLTPWMDGRTIAPGILVLADGPAVARLQAAALAIGAMAVNLIALGAARFTSALPRDWGPERL